MQMAHKIKRINRLSHSVVKKQMWGTTVYWFLGGVAPHLIL